MTGYAPYPIPAEDYLSDEGRLLADKMARKGRFFELWAGPRATRTRAPRSWTGLLAAVWRLRGYDELPVCDVCEGSGYCATVDDLGEVEDAWLCLKCRDQRTGELLPGFAESAAHARAVEDARGGLYGE